MPSKLYSVEAEQTSLGDPCEPKAVTEEHAQAKQAAKGGICRKGLGLSGLIGQSILEASPPSPKP